MTPFSKLFVIAATSAVVFTACGGRTPERAQYAPLAEVETTYGRLITAGNHPTQDQNGTGERIGLFQDVSGAVWGLPLIVSKNGAVLACAPPALHQAKVTDTFPAGSAIIGTTNEPTGWRGGTGNLELLLREAGGAVRWLTVRGAAVDGGPVCWASESPGPPQKLYYYRLAPAQRDSQYP
jgi:hypothetical protein